MRGVLGGAEFPHDLRRGEHERGHPPQGATHPPWPSTLLRGGRDARSGMQLGGQLPSSPARLHPQRERGEGGMKQFYERGRTAIRAWRDISPTLEFLIVAAVAKNATHAQGETWFFFFFLESRDTRSLACLFIHPPFGSNVSRKLVDLFEKSVCCRV